MSGGSPDGRTELAIVLELLGSADEFVVTRLDRLGRDTRDILNLIHEAEERGAFVTVLDPHVSTRGEMGYVMLTVLGMVAQMSAGSGCPLTLQVAGVLTLAGESAVRSTR